LTKAEVSNKLLYSTIMLSYSNNSFDDFVFSAYQESMKKDAKDHEKSDDEEKSVKADDVGKECKFCGAFPCLVNAVYGEMMFVAAGMEDEAENKEIRYALYTFVTKKLWGKLGRGFCKCIPHCIVAEIHDAYPAKNGTTYVGFKDNNGGDGDVVDDGISD
jgi:hypothetical protein